ncbi:MAG: Trp biosynthesis-associated membrane protein [Marmoricola sp.]
MPEGGGVPSRFLPVVLGGVGTATITAVSSARAWFHLEVPTLASISASGSEIRADMPLALALSLLVLASWGVVLVTGTRVRRLVLVVALLAGLGVLVCAVVAPFTLPDQIRRQLLDGDHQTIFPTVSYVVACVAAVLMVGAVAVGWRLAPRWPVMSSRYDAPGADRTRAELDPATAEPLEVWKALDEGRDPTAPPAS